MPDSRLESRPVSSRASEASPAPEAMWPSKLVVKINKKAPVKAPFLPTASQGAWCAYPLLAGDGEGNAGREGEVKLLSRVRLFVTPWSPTRVPTRILCPWDFPGNSTGVDCHFLLQGIFPTQGSNPGLPHCRQTLYCLSHQGRWSSGSG